MQLNGTTQQELSSVLGISRQAIGYYRDGTSSPDFEKLVKIANYFNVSTDYLLGASPYMNRKKVAFDELGFSEITTDRIMSLSTESIDIINRFFGCGLSAAELDKIIGTIQVHTNTMLCVAKYMEDHCRDHSWHM